MIYIFRRCFFMNIQDINNNIYGIKNLKEGEYTDFLMKSIEQKEMEKINFDSLKNNENNNMFKKINKEIKF